MIATLITRQYRRFAGLLFLVLFLGTCLRAEDVVVADFEAGLPSGITGGNAELALSSQSPAQGRNCLRVELRDAKQQAYVKVGFADARISNSSALHVAARAPAVTQPVNLRWLALDQSDRIIFQRRLQLDAGVNWVNLQAPVVGWRWGNDRTGDWSEVRSVVLRIETPVAQLEFDDIRITPNAAKPEPAKWLAQLAFGDAATRMVEAEGLMIATDAVDDFSEERLRNLLAGMRRIRGFVRKIAADAARPTNLPSPAALLIFRDPDNRKQFFGRLGQEWKATIAPPASAGYTVQDIATAIFKPGPDRPVYLHEATHAIVARELRLMSGVPLHDSLQEGLANYVQLCLYPQSLDRQVYPNHFQREIDPAGKGFFRPLKMLTAGDVRLEQYAQAAALIAYLMEHDRATFVSWCKGAADGKRLEAILKDQGKNIDDLEAAWMKWGRRKFAEAPAEDAKHFPTPAELEGKISG